MARTHKPDISPTTRGRVYQCILDKKTYRNIAAQFNISLGEISSLKKRFEKRGHLRTAPRSGRPHVLTDRSERHVASLMRRGKASNASALKRNYYPDISVWTIRRALNKAGLRAYRPRKVPHLNKIQRQVRKVWATKLKTWDFRHWECLFFSDEAKFNVYRSDGGEKVWRERGEAYNPKYTIKTKKFGGGSVMCWGCITPWGVGQLHRITTTMDRHVFIQILSESLIGTLEVYHIHPQDIFFQQDNDPKHIAKDTCQWFAEKHIKLLPWPAQSPDLNPIENLWDYLASRVSKRETPPTNPDALWDALQEEWYKIDVGLIHKLYRSMPRRLAKVIRARGWSIPY